MTNFADDIADLLNLARFAPSSHNTQPWKVTVRAAESRLTIGFDPGRQLLVGDADRRELYMSLGCFTESLVLAAGDAGYVTRIDYRGGQADGVLDITLSGGQTAAADGLSELLPGRRSDRRPYDDRPLEPAILQALDGERCGDSQLQLFTETADIERLAQATYDATLRAMSDDAFRAELASWVRNNWTRQPDGMPAYVQGIPGPVSLVAPLVIRKNPAIAKDQAKKDGQRIRHSAAIGLIICPGTTPQAYVEAGRLYQRAGLRSAQHDVRTAGLSAAVIDRQTVQQLQRDLKLSATPVGLLRFGYKTGQPKASPRLAVDQFTVTG